MNEKICVNFAAQYQKDVISLCVDRRGQEISTSQVDDTRIMMQFIFPLNEIVVDFHDQLKRITSGFASFDYEDNEFIKSDLTKVRISYSVNYDSLVFKYCYTRVFID